LELVELENVYELKGVPALKQVMFKDLQSLRVADLGMAARGLQLALENCAALELLRVPLETVGVASVRRRCRGCRVVEVEGGKVVEGGAGSGGGGGSDSDGHAEKGESASEQRMDKETQSMWLSITRNWAG
jgi:hypothetical protein